MLYFFLFSLNCSVAECLPKFKNQCYSSEKKSLSSSCLFWQKPFLNSERILHSLFPICYHHNLLLSLLIFKVWHFHSLLMVHPHDLTHGRCFVEWCLGCIYLSLFTHFTLLFYRMCSAAVKHSPHWGELSSSNLNESIKWCLVLLAWESSCAALLHLVIRLRCPLHDPLFMDKTTKICIEEFTSWSRCGIENISFFFLSSSFPPRCFPWDGSALLWSASKSCKTHLRHHFLIFPWSTSRIPRDRGGNIWLQQSCCRFVQEPLSYVSWIKMCKSNSLCQINHLNHRALRKTVAAFRNGINIQCSECTYFQLNLRPSGWNHLPAAIAGSRWKLRRPWGGVDTHPNWRAFFFGSCLYDIGSVLGIWPPSRRQQAFSQSAVRTDSAKLSHLYSLVVSRMWQYHGRSCNSSLRTKKRQKKKSHC